MQPAHLQDNLNDPIKVSIRVELLDSNLIPLVDVTMPALHKTYEEYGIEGLFDPGFDTCIHALANYFKDVWRVQAKEMREMIGLENNGLSKICGKYPDGSASSKSCYYYMYMVNDQFPMPEGGNLGYRMADYPLQDGDCITIYANRYPYISYYAYFEKQEFQVNVGESIRLKLLGSSIFGGNYTPLSDAGLEVQRNGESITLETNIVTDELGEAEIRLDTPGIYTISTEREDISRAHAIIKVGAMASIYIG